jgi:hypothetical protein
METTVINREIALQALANRQIHDFEDGLEYYSALKQRCNCIITENREDFHFSEIEVFDCESF